MVDRVIGPGHEASRNEISKKNKEIEGKVLEGMQLKISGVLLSNVLL